MLVISVRKDTRLDVGALGNLSLSRGLYIYVGSAQNNLENRVLRHFRMDKKRYWHIDYLLESEDAKITNVFYNKKGKTEECQLAKKIEKENISIEGFGSSDCKCGSHLFRIKDSMFMRKFTSENNMQTLWV